MTNIEYFVLFPCLAALTVCLVMQVLTLVDDWFHIKPHKKRFFLTIGNALLEILIIALLLK